MKNSSVTMDMMCNFDRMGLTVPSRNNMALKIALAPMLDNEDKTSVEIQMPAGSSSETVNTHRSYPSHSGGEKSSHTSHSTIKSRHGATDTWWNVGDFISPSEQQRSHSDTTFSKTNDEDIWDLSDSIVDLYKEVNKYDGVRSMTPVNKNNKIDNEEWLNEDTNNGFVHVYRSDTDTHPRMFPCTLTTTAQKLCIQCGMPPNSLHVQLNGDIMRRLDPFDSPLAIQNEYLQNIGYFEQRKIQEIGTTEDLAYLVKFYAGKPVSDSTYSRNQLTSFVYVRKGKLIHQWVRRLCVIAGTRLLIYRDKTKSGSPTIVQLAKGQVEEVQNIKGHNHVLKVTSTLQGERSVYLSFSDVKDFNKWLRKTKKATAKLPTKADLSNCHLEFLPETVFINEELEILNLRHNVLKERPIEEDIYTIGWLDDLPRFTHLRSLNLADNNLRSFPLAVCKMKTLTELNLASNKIEDIPPTIVNIECLQMLHLHNNHLDYLPDEISQMRNLLVLVLAFNLFTTVPGVLLQSTESQLRIDSLIMAGNRIEKLSQDVLNRISHIKKVDFRMNKLHLSPSEMAKFHLLENVTHLDIRDNLITDLDVRALRQLEYLNCDRNKINTLQVNGSAIKILSAVHNEMTTFSVSPKPEWLSTLDVSYNKLEMLPSWICDCFFLVQLIASHNHLQQLPEKFLSGTPKLKVLKASHNRLTELPSLIGHPVIESISLEHNLLTSLPDTLFVNIPKLRYVCLTNNQLETIPDANSNIYQNKLNELYLSANKLGDDVIHKITLFHKLKILHLAYNRITEIHDRDLRKLDNLQELNISGNFLRHLPKCVGKHSKLQALRANANLLKELPDFRYSLNLKVLEVGSNRLMDVSVTNLMASNVNLLDISGNPEMSVSSLELKGIKTKKKVCMVDIKGQNRSLLDLRAAGFDDIEIPWQSGLSQTSGMRNKLSVSIINRPKFNDGQEGLFALFDGGRNDEVTRILSNKIIGIMEDEIKHSVTGKDYLKYTMLAAHRKLKMTGQKVGAAGAICHIVKPKDTNHYMLNVANVGDVEIVVCRRGEAVVLSKLFTVSHDKTEMERICKNGGIVTEDNKINGVTQNTRLLGSSYLFPFVIPDPHTSSTTLQPDDQLIIIANQGLWKYMSYQETVNEIINIPDPVLAAKKLQDLVQGYNSVENIGVLVIRLMLSSGERNKIRELFHNQFEMEQKLLAELKVRDIDREEKRKRAELEEQKDSIPMDIVKIKNGKKRKQMDGVFKGESSKNGEFPEDIVDELDGVSVIPLPRKHLHDDTSNVDPAVNWELMLQRRLTEEVKDKELIHAMRVHGGEYDPYFPTLDSDDNWSTTTKLKGQVKERTVTLPPNEVNTQAPPLPPPAPHRPVFSNHSQISSESLFKRELKHPLNVDRDAILFHNMQLSRQKSHHLSSRSIDSIQSDPAYASVKEMSKGRKSSSHSIEVLLHGPTAYHERQKSFGGSHKIPKQEVEMKSRDPKGDSCPSGMKDRLKMLEDKGFLPQDTPADESEDKSHVDRKIPVHEIDGELDGCNNTNIANIADTVCVQTEVNDNKDRSNDMKKSHDSEDLDLGEGFLNDLDGYETIGGISKIQDKQNTDDSLNDQNDHHVDAGNDNVIDSALPDTGSEQLTNNSASRKYNSAEILPEKVVKDDENLSELYATVRKVRKIHNENVKDNDSEVNNTSVKAENDVKPIDNDNVNTNDACSNAQHVNTNSDVGKIKSTIIKVDRSIPDNNKMVTETSGNHSRPKTPVRKNFYVPPESVQSVRNNARSPAPNKVTINKTELTSSPNQQQNENDNMNYMSEHKLQFKKRPAPKVEDSRRSKSPVSFYQGKSNFVQQQSQKFIQNADYKDSVTEEPRRSKSPVTYTNGVSYRKSRESPSQGYSRSMNNSPNPIISVDKPSTKEVRSRSRSKSPVSYKGLNQLPDVVKHTEPQSSYHDNVRTTGDNSVRNVSAEVKRRAPPPIPPRVPLKQFEQQFNIDANSLKSLEDLIAYNRLQQQKVSYKITPRVAPTPPPKIPETSMISKTASQKSVVITYL
ncbi:PH domain leucine-rich repeat-containing protein phosphatase 2 [Mactra antiquata]